MSLLQATTSEAEAAGLSTLMKKLGVSLKEAKAIKAAAQASKGTGLADENLRALGKVKDYKQGNLKRFGQGADAEVFDAGDSVLKVPRNNVQTHPDVIKSQAVDAASPVMLDDLGVPTKNIKTSQNMYQVQDKLKTPKVRPGNDSEFKALDNVQSNIYDKTLDFMRQERIPLTSTDDLKKYMTPEDSAWYDELEALKEKRIQNMWKEQGIDPDSISDEFMSLPPKEFSDARQTHQLFGEDVKEYPMDTLAALTDMKARKSTKGVYPQDVHSGNIGLDAENNAKIFDTSRFKLKDPNEIGPEQFEKIKQSIIASPEKKDELLSQLTSKNSTMKKAAAVSPLAGLETEDDGMLSQARDSVLSGLSSVINSPTAQGAMDLLSVPGAIGRASINAVAENRAPTMEEIKRAATFPTGQEQEDLATSATEKVFPDEEDVYKRTALDSLLKFM